MEKKKAKKSREKGSLIKTGYTSEELDRLELRGKLRKIVNEENARQAKLRGEEIERNLKKLKKNPKIPTGPLMIGNIPVDLKVFTWSPGLRDEFLDIQRVPGDRDLDVDRMVALRNSIHQVRMEFRLAKYIVEPTGRCLRGNGNTCMNLSIVCPELFEGAKIVECTYHVSSMEEAMLCHLVVDNPESSRNGSEQRRPYSVANAIVLKDGIQQGLLSGIRFAETGVYSKEKDGYIRDVVGPNRPYIQWYAGLDMPKHYSRAPISAGIYCMWLIDPDESFKFCEAIKKHDFTDNNIPREPRSMLDRWIELNNAPKNQTRKDHLEQFNWVRYAWNYWRRGESVDAVYEKSGPAPRPGYPLEAFDGLTPEHTARLKITSVIYPKKSKK